MTTPQLILSILIGLLIGALTYRFLHRHAMPEPIHVPRHIAVSEMDDHEPQEVYDWVVYATRMTGTQYLEQLAFERGCRHAYLLCDLRTTLHAKTQEELLEWIKEIGYSHRLSTAIVDQPI